ncbi:MAG: hypothetical protein ACI30J_08170 [Paludibacteraceae bacterium]
MKAINLERMFCLLNDARNAFLTGLQFMLITICLPALLLLTVVVWLDEVKY